MLHKGFLPDNGKGPRKGVDSKEGGVGSKGSVGGRRKQQAVLVVNVVSVTYCY